MTRNKILQCMLASTKKTHPTASCVFISGFQKLLIVQTSLKRPVLMNEHMQAQTHGRNCSALIDDGVTLP